MADCFIPAQSPYALGVTTTLKGLYCLMVGAERRDADHSQSGDVIG
jgi:hypothetical protein